MRIRPLLLLPFLLLGLGPSATWATTISPFPNLGEMAVASDAVVLATVKRNYTFEEGTNLRFRTTLEVLQTVKGPLQSGHQFAVQNYHLQIDDLERQIWGDLELEKGQTYFLFLDQIDNDLWRAQMLSYGALQEVDHHGQKLLVPMDLGREVHFHYFPGQAQAEKLAVYDKAKFIPMLRRVVQNTGVWDRSQVATEFPPESFQAGYRSTPPSQCTFISGTPYARWPNFETTSLPVRYGAGGDPGCTNTGNEVAAAIGNVVSNYGGVNLSNAGTHSFIPSCTGGEGATDSEFTTWVSTNLGGSRHLLIQFEDPCSDITDLTGCSGTLAIGGLYWFSSTHSANGETWRNAAYGYVVVNNGTGACDCGSTDYEIMLTHELTHSLNIGHIASSEGAANMNPSCCNTISSLDIGCLDYIYVPAAVPVELIEFRGELRGEQVVLEWSSASEWENDFYQIERRNAQGKFEPLTKVASLGNSIATQDYEFVDDSPLVGTNYYRLSQTDLDATPVNLGTVAVDYFDRLRVGVNPNPLDGDLLQSQIVTERPGDADLRVLDLTGRQVNARQLKLDRGSNQIEWPLENLASGVYFLEVRIADRREMVKFVRS
ncbi:MAG: T9SS type A sorting domain-containing protein [Bacteroidota bacterium]